VVLRLIGDIFSNFIHAGLANGKTPITVLPTKFREALSLGLDPLGSRAFDFHDDPSKRMVFVQHKQNVNVIAPGVDCIYVGIEVLQDRRRIEAQGAANGFGQDPFAVLGAEDKMNEVFSERLRHRSILAPLQGARQSRLATRGVAPGCLPSALSAPESRIDTFSHSSGDDTRLIISLLLKLDLGQYFFDVLSFGGLPGCDEVVRKA
jgi:hypothetical protein